MYKVLVKHTYDKIFVEGLHFLSRGDVGELKKIILKDWSRLSNKLDKVLFIAELARKIKDEKIDEGLRQKTEYGQVIMNDFEKIKSLYDWLERLADEGEVEKSKKEDAWKAGEDILLELSQYLQKEEAIDEAEAFYECLFSNNYKNRVNWKRDKTLLIYLFEELKDKEFLSRSFSENSFIEGSFLANGKFIENVKQLKNGMKNNKNPKPRNHVIVDVFIEKYKNTLPLPQM